MNQPSKPNTGHLVVGIVLIVIGILAIIGQLVGGGIWAYLWPGFVLLPGILMFIGMFLGGKKAGGLAIPATILTILGLVLFYQNTFDQWWTWSFVWALVGPVAAGLGIVLFGAYTGDQGARRGGMVVLLIGLVLLVIFGLAFGLGRAGALGYVLPLALIGLGVYIVIARMHSSASMKNNVDDDKPQANL